MHNGTLISDLQSLVAKFASSGVDSDTGRIEVAAGSKTSQAQANLGHNVANGNGSRCNSDLLASSSPKDLSSASPSAGEGLVVDELTYCSYRHNRVTNPHIEAWRWSRLFGDSSVRWMEDRYQAEIRGCDADVMTGLDDSMRCGSSEICGDCLNCKSHCVCGGAA